ncbi:hypothetical protein OS493_025292 [Desmophyllum pertusum]|uniref:Uncharacterized protein n=1 Tax=Desmophyllum pertusum TaxID=174260 RepID=A0A9W9ZAL8_9CNID|nr:hypothetical protein OS493_025292 [Desmophyllum pertusum]
MEKLGINIQIMPGSSWLPLPNGKPLVQFPKLFMSSVKLVCNFRTIAGGLLVVGSTLALRSCSSPEEFIDAFNKVILVASSKLVEISEGSLCFTVQADTPSA